MAKYTIVRPDGSKVVVEGPPNNKAGAFAEYKRQREALAWNEYQHLPLGNRVGRAFDDQARIAANAMAFGSQHIADRLASIMPGGDYEREKFLTEQARLRAGTAGTAMEGLGIASTAAALPSAGPRIAARFGGPDWLQGITKGIVSIPETAGLMTGQALAEGTDPLEEGWKGAMFGPAAHLLVGGAKGVLSAANWADKKLGRVPSGLIAKGARKVADAGKFTVRGLKDPVMAEVRRSLPDFPESASAAAGRFGKNYLGPIFATNAPEQTKSFGERVGEKIGRTLYGKPPVTGAAGRFGAATLNDPLTGATPEEVVAQKAKAEADAEAAAVAKSDAAMLAKVEERPNETITRGPVDPSAPPIKTGIPKGPLADAAGVVAAPGAVGAVQPTPAGPLAAAAEPRRLINARTGLTRSRTALDDVEKQLADPNIKPARQRALETQKTALTKAIAGHQKTISKFSVDAPVSPKVAEDTALESAGAATPTGVLAEEPMRSPIPDIEDRIRAINIDLGSGIQMDTKERAALGAEMKSLRLKLAEAKIAESHAAEAVTKPAGPLAPSVADLQTAHDTAKAKMLEARAQLMRVTKDGNAKSISYRDGQLKEAVKTYKTAKAALDKAGVTAPTAAAVEAVPAGSTVAELTAAHKKAEAEASRAMTDYTKAVSDRKSAHIQTSLRAMMDHKTAVLNNAKIDLDNAVGSTAEAVVPRKAAAGVLSAEKVLPEPNVRPGINPKTGKPLSVKGLESAGDPNKVSKAEKAKAAAKAAKAEPTPEELHAEAVQKVTDAIHAAEIERRSGVGGAGFDVALSSEINPILKNRELMSRFTPEEAAAITKMSQGDPATHVARWLSKFPTLQSTASTFGGGAMLGIAAHPLLGAAMTAIPPAGGLLGRFVKGSAARQNSQAALNILQKQTPAAPIIDPNRQANLTKILRMLIGGGP